MDFRDVADRLAALIPLSTRCSIEADACSRELVKVNCSFAVLARDAHVVIDALREALDKK